MPSTALARLKNENGRLEWPPVTAIQSVKVQSMLTPLALIGAAHLVISSGTNFAR